MTILAIGAERARHTEIRARFGWQRLRPFGRFLATTSGGAFDLLRGLVEAYWDHPAAARAGDRLDQRKAEDRAGNPSDVFAASSLTAGLKRLGHVHLRSGNLASFAAAVKFPAAPDRHSGWSFGARQVIELGPDDEV